MTPFHYAFKVRDLASTRKFYIEILGCKEGRSTDSWIDFDFFGHQLSAHLSEHIPELDYCGTVDGVKVPIPHFGCILKPDQFKKIQHNLESAKVNFIVKPLLRYQGQVGEQMTLFVLDLSGNPLEFKMLSRQDELFSD